VTSGNARWQGEWNERGSLLSLAELVAQRLPLLARFSEADLWPGIQAHQPLFAVALPAEAPALSFGFDQEIEPAGVEDLEHLLSGRNFDSPNAVFCEHVGYPA
jgi:hypothetical protein